MDELRAFEVDPYRTELDTEVTAVGDEQGGPHPCLADTLLYPEGGGQPADHGEIAGVRVLDVQREGGVVRHYLEAPLALGRAAVRLDWERRYDHMQHHTGQHLLSALAEDGFGWVTTSFHLGGETCDVELATPAIPPASRERLAEAVAAAVRAARPVRPRWVALADYGGLDVRSRGLPEGHVGDVRLIEIEGIDLNTCGGTHLRSTAEIEALHLLGSEPMRGGTRLYFVAGARARQRMAGHELLRAELRRLLGVGDGEIVAALEAKLTRIGEAARRERALRADLAALVAADLAARSERPGVRHFEALDGAFLQDVARRMVAAAPRQVALLTAGGPGAGVFVVAAGAESGIELRLAGAAVAAALDGRGGGTGGIYQGKAQAIDRRAAAAEALARAMA